MQQKSTEGADRFLTEREASTLTGLSVAWFQRSRWSGGGPPFIKISRAVRYSERSLIAWLQARTQISTSQASAK